MRTDGLPKQFRYAICLKKNQVGEEMILSELSSQKVRKIVGSRLQANKTSLKMTKFEFFPSPLQHCNTLLRETLVSGSSSQRVMTSEKG